MHIKPDINVMDFLKQTQKCNSEVLFETPEGDSISLKSTLSQYIFCIIAENASLLQNGTIRFFREEDRELPEGLQLPSALFQSFSSLSLS